MSADWDRFPRVLLVCKALVDQTSGNGASLRNWFLQWPSDRIAQIFSSSASDENFIRRVYHLRGRDRVAGRVFDYVKCALPSLACAEPLFTGGRRHPWTSLHGVAQRVARRVLVDSGLWELVFQPRISPALEEWIRSLKPDVIFTQGADLTFMTVSMLLSRRFQTPLCVMVNDDWPAHLYADTCFAPVIRPFVIRTFRKLLSMSSVRLAAGSLMCQEYQWRYALPFEPLMICDDSSRFARAERKRPVPEDCISIVYCGSLGANRWHGIADLAAAALSEPRHPRQVVISVYAPSLPSRAAELSRNPLIRLMPPVSHDELPGILKGADILFLTESFDPGWRKYIRYSISTKCHLYMMSGRPILAYGPAEIGTISYAQSGGWAKVVQIRDVRLLREALHDLTQPLPEIDALRARARQVSVDNHEGSVVRERLRRRLLESARAPRRRRGASFGTPDAPAECGAYDPRISPTASDRALSGRVCCLSGTRQTPSN